MPQCIKEEQRVLFHLNSLNLCTKKNQAGALEVCRKIKGSLSSDDFERRTSTGKVLFALLSRDFEHIREKKHSNTTNLVVSLQEKVHFRLTCVAQKRRCLNSLKTVTVGKHLPAPFITLPSPPSFLSTQRNRQLKQQRQQRLRKSHLKSEFALPQILSRL